jgi:hypothetical protein
MNRATLLKRLSSPIGKQEILALSLQLHDEGYDFNDLLELTLHSDYQTAFRSAWILENYMLNHPIEDKNYHTYFLKQFTAVTNLSCMRHYSKILMHITASKKQNDINLYTDKRSLQAVIEKCFDWLIDPEIPVAVKSSCFEAMYNLKEAYPWIEEELAEQIHFSMKNGSPAIIAKGKKLLKKLSVR